MDFAFSEEQDEFRGVVRRFLEERWSAAEVRKLAETPSFDPDLEAGGGTRAARTRVARGLRRTGLGFIELGIALEEMGRCLAGGPFLASAVIGAHAIQLAATAAQRAALLPGLASGETIATLAVLEASGRQDADAIAATCRRDGDGWRVTGRKIAVLDAQNADLLVVAAREAGSRGEAGVSLLVVRADAAGVIVKPADGLDLTRKLGEVELVDAAATLLGDAGAAWPALARTLDLAAIAVRPSRSAPPPLSRDGGGLRQSRIQFARPIGSFQAIKHKTAEVMLELESARSAAYWSWWVAAQPEVSAADLAEAASVAKATCNDAFLRAAAENVQIHGGVGFTWEFDCHLYYRRAKTSEFLFGDPLWHRARIAAQLGL
jgi:alkylation response protein AidB-like acyl-CoA dehydrogenase